MKFAELGSVIRALGENPTEDELQVNIIEDIDGKEIEELFRI